MIHIHAITNTGPLVIIGRVGSQLQLNNILQLFNMSSPGRGRGSVIGQQQLCKRKFKFSIEWLRSIVGLEILAYRLSYLTYHSLLAVQPAHLTSHHWLVEEMLGDGTVLPLVQTVAITVLLLRSLLQLHQLISGRNGSSITSHDAIY